MGATSETPILA